MKRKEKLQIWSNIGIKNENLILIVSGPITIVLEKWPGCNNSCFYISKTKSNCKEKKIKKKFRIQVRDKSYAPKLDRAKTIEAKKPLQITTTRHNLHDYKNNK